MISQSISNNKEIVTTSIKFVALIGIATLTPLLDNQFITGPLVNATLFLSVLLIGTKGAVMIAVIPGIIALSTGLLPAIMAPILPFVIIGNIFLVMVFDKLKKSYWTAVISASLIKFAFLFLTSSIIANIILKDDIVIKVATMMSWPQLVTALAGGLIARLIMNK